MGKKVHGCTERRPERGRKCESEETPWMCLPAVLAGFQAPSVTLSISTLLCGDNGLSALQSPCSLLPSER